MLFEEHQLIGKPWGYETIHENDKENNLCCKTLTINPQLSTSKHRHSKKEVMLCVHGMCEITFYNERETKRIELFEGDAAAVEPLQWHRISNPLRDVTCRIVEASNYHDDNDIERAQQ